MPGPLSHLRVVDLTDLRGALAGSHARRPRRRRRQGRDRTAAIPAGLRAPFAGGVASPDRALAVPVPEREQARRGARLRRRRGRSAARRALRRAPTSLVENLRARGAAALGLAPDALRARHPHLVHVVLADFGLAGPRAGWRLEALPAFAASGALFASGFADRAPCWLPGYLAHDCGALFAVVGALAAILERARTAAVRPSTCRCRRRRSTRCNPWSIPARTTRASIRRCRRWRPRNADGAYCVLQTADGYVRSLPATPRQWGAFVELLAVRGARRARVDVLALPSRERRRDPHARVRGAARAAARRGARAGARAGRADGAGQPPRGVRRGGADEAARLLPADRIPASRRRALRVAAVQPARDAGRRPASGAGARRRTTAASRRARRRHGRRAAGRFSRASASSTSASAWPGRRCAGSSRSSAPRS